MPSPRLRSELLSMARRSGYVVALAAVPHHADTGNTFPFHELARRAATPIVSFCSSAVLNRQYDALMVQRRYTI